MTTLAEFEAAALDARRQGLRIPCLESKEPDAWFPTETAVGTDPFYAAGLCDGCPVLGVCRQYALANPELHGIWGGLTEQDRTAMRSRRAAS